MNRNSPAPVKTSTTIKKIEESISSIWKLAQSEQQPNSARLVDRLAAETKKLQTEVDRLSTKLRSHVKILREVDQDAYVNRHPSGKSLEGETRMELLLCWSYIIEGVLDDIILITSSTISSTSLTLSTLLPTFINALPLLPRNKQTRTTSQRHLNTAYEAALKSSSTLTFITTKLKDNLFTLTATAILHISSEASKNFAHDLIHSCHPPKDSFPIAQQSARKLMKLFVKMLSPSFDEGKDIRRYNSKVGILLRVLENYFYRQPRRRRHNLLGELEPAEPRKGFPVASVNMFQVQEIGGILAGLLCACTALKVGTAKAGLGGRILGTVERRMKTLKRCLEIMWVRERGFINKVHWMRSPQRVVRKVKRKADRTKEEEDTVPQVTPKPGDWGAHAAKKGPKTPADDPRKRERDYLKTEKMPNPNDGLKMPAPDDWEVRAAQKAFGAEKVPTTGNKAEKEEFLKSSTPDQVEVGAGEAEGRKKKKRKKGGRKHGGGGNK